MTNNEEGSTSPAVAALAAACTSKTLSSDDSKNIGIRPFRSRKTRPCDSCRRRKSRCTILEVGQPCVECKQSGKDCTFIAPPTERRRQPTEAAEANPANKASPIGETSISPGSFAGISADTNYVDTAFYNMVNAQDDALVRFAPDTQLPRSKRFKSASVSDLGNIFTQDASHVFPAVSLPALPAMPAYLDVPVTIPADPLHRDGYEPSVITTLVTDDLLPVRAKGRLPSESPLVTHHHGSDHIQISTGRPTFFVFHKVPSHRRSSSETSDALYRRITSVLALHGLEADGLLKHYLHHFQPAYPVLREDSNGSSTHLSKAIQCVGLAKSTESHLRARNLQSFLWETIKDSSLSEILIEQAELESITFALLELSGRPPLDIRGDYLFLAKTIAQAQLLGLHLDSTSWRITPSERLLRSRLWWTIRIHDAWSSFLNSRPSLLQQGNSSVRPPSLGQDAPAFVYMCRLSSIVARFQSEVCTVNHSGENRKRSNLTTCQDVELELADLSEDLHVLPSGFGAPGNANLLLHLYGFRCMVHRISIELAIGLGSNFQPSKRSLDIFNRFVTFVQSIQAVQMQGFWLPYASHILSSCLSSLIRLSLASITSGLELQGADVLTLHPIAIARRLCAALTTAHTEHGWISAEAALKRAVEVSGRLRAISAPGSDYSPLIAALEGQDESASSGSRTVSIDENASQLLHTGNATQGEDFRLLWNTDFSWPNLDEWLSALGQGDTQPLGQPLHDIASGPFATSFTT